MPHITLGLTHKRLDEILPKMPNWRRTRWAVVAMGSRLDTRIYLWSPHRNRFSYKRCHLGQLVGELVSFVPPDAMWLLNVGF